MPQKRGKLLYSRTYGRRAVHGSTNVGKEDVTMTNLEMIEPVSGLKDLIGTLESLFAQTAMWREIERDYLFAQTARMSNGR